MEWILLGIAAIAAMASIGYALVTVYRKGIRKGADDFLLLLLKNGYEQKVTSFREQNKHVMTGGIVFLGDSITQDFPIHDFFSGLLVYNRGIGGDTTLGLLNRLDCSVFDLNPNAVVLLIGTNDFAILKHEPMDVYRNMHKIVDEIRHRLPSSRILLLSIYPVNRSMDAFSVGNRSNRDIQETNRLLATIPSVEFVDLYRDLSIESGDLNPVYSVEGLHINQNGYALIAKKIRIVLENPAK